MSIEELINKLKNSKNLDPIEEQKLKKELKDKLLKFSEILMFFKLGASKFYSLAIDCLNNNDYKNLEKLVQGLKNTLNSQYTNKKA